MTLRFSEKYDHQFLHVFIFNNTFPESHGSLAVPVKISKKIVSLHKLDRDQLEHVSLIQLVISIAMTLRKCQKYKNIRKWMTEFIKKSGSRGDKIVRVNSIRITNSILL